MNTSDDGLEKLIKREGEKLKAYKDSKGIWTVGVGDTDLNNDGIRDVTSTTVLTEEESRADFALDITWAENVVNTVQVPLTQEQFDALVSFVFNIGGSAFKASTMLKLLNQGDYTGAAKQFDRWVIPAELTARRMSEKEQFLG